jgi:hypothetical protein
VRKHVTVVFLKLVYFTEHYDHQLHSFSCK